jgi:hypothetical protein
MEGIFLSMKKQHIFLSRYYFSIGLACWKTTTTIKNYRKIVSCPLEPWLTDREKPQVF